ncbi:MULTISPECIES: AMP-binding protein [unclassified Acinetobacter]|uniref:AMP-binding protein n=1 Tax=unclassified Acinetobacter TaxID=196816 RepID=UPI00293490CA|nr:MULTISPECIES: AMP-binding protein [unclassified Acinetobacter]WOE33296.1 AMP-binding protein [Acinetobacter sp. SAAs470]WOE37046.1 AMP-binding protein [Acinetobacter sp. SAAs474]
MYKFIEKLFSERNFNNTAVFFKGRKYKYEELYNDVVKLSSQISMEVGGNKRHRIGFMLDKSYDSLCVMLAIMHSGNIYVPLNKKSPLSKLKLILKRYDILNVITNEDFDFFDCNFINIDDLKRIVVPSSSFEKQINNSKENYAYIIFTSGSTGFPKAVGITYENLESFIESMNEVVNIANFDKVSFFADYFFDFSIAEIFLTLSNDSCLVIPEELEKRNPLKFVNDNHISVWMSVPSYANYCIEFLKLKKYNLNSIRMTIFCGEGLSVKLADSWKVAAPNTEIFNAYGPTEATVFSTIYKYDYSKKYDSYLVPIGSNLKHIKSKIVSVDSNGFGELLLSGGQVFEGYLLENKIKNWYKTGDIVYLDDYGIYNFFCRIDFQIKRNGYRIDINEIKNILLNYIPHVEVEIVDIKINNLIKVIFILEKEEYIADLESTISNHLEIYMRPDEIVVLDEIPLNHNGKIDYKEVRVVVSKIINNTGESK